MWRFAAVAAAVLPFIAAAGPAEQLSALEMEIKAAESKHLTIDSARRQATKEIAEIKLRLAELASTLKKRQAQLREAQQWQAEVAADLAKLRNDLKRQSAIIGELTKSLVKLGLKNPQLSHLNVIRANQGVRGLAVLAATRRQLQWRAEDLRDKLSGIVSAMERLEQSRTQKRLAQTALSEDRKRLRAMLKRKHALKKSIDKDFAVTEERLARLAAAAANLRELITSLSPNKGHDASIPARNLSLPAEGFLAENYGATAKGIKISSPPQSRVIAPWGGEVLFANRFRDYGPMVIIYHGGGFHSIISGLGRVDVIPGAQIIKGEPIGAIGSAPLYFEWRRQGTPINPLPWLAEKPQKRG